MWSQFAKPITAPQQPVKAPPQKLLIEQCAIDRTRLVAVRRPNGYNYLYEYDSDLDKMTPHHCVCQSKVTQMGLQPLYSAYSERISSTVIFVFNTLTTKTEQYVYHFETDHFEQVEKTGLVFNPTQSSNHSVVALLKGANDEQIMIERDQIGGLRKMLWKSGCFKAMDPSRVVSLMMKSLEAEEEEDSDSEYDSDEEDSEEDTAFNKYIDSLEPYRVSTCTHGQVVNVFNYNTYGYRGFAYNNATGDFHLMDCGCEVEIKVKEANLSPKYVEFHDNQYVIHVFNNITGLFEKYCIEDGGLRQVDYPELEFNFSKTASSSPVVLVSTGAASTMVILKDPTTGRLTKEQFCSVQSKYVTMQPEPVKTFIVQRKEAEKKRKEAKTSRELSYQEQLAQLDELAKDTTEMAKRIAEKTAAAFRRQEAERKELRAQKKSAETLKAPPSAARGQEPAPKRTETGADGEPKLKKQSSAPKPAPPAPKVPVFQAPDKSTQQAYEELLRRTAEWENAQMKYQTEVLKNGPHVFPEDMWSFTPWNEQFQQFQFPAPAPSTAQQGAHPSNNASGLHPSLSMFSFYQPHLMSTPIFRSAFKSASKSKTDNPK